MNSPQGPLLSGLTARIVGLCRLRGGPQDLPYSPNLLAALVVAATALDVLIGGLVDDTGSAFGRSLLSTFVVLGLCWVALAIRGLGSRYVQTAIALLACSLVFSLLQLPIALLAEPLAPGASTLSGSQLLLGWISIAVLAWQLSVYAHIVRQAMEAPFALAFALAASWVLAYWALEHLLFGAAA